MDTCEAFALACDRSRIPKPDAFEAVLDGLAELDFVSVGGGDYAFNDPLLQDALILSTPVKRRRLMHAFVARRLRQMQRSHAKSDVLPRN